MGVNAVEKLSDIIELYRMNEFMDDAEVERGLLKLASILQRSDVHPTKVARHVVECDSLATLYAIKAKYYMTIGKDEPGAREKKNFYMTMREEFHTLAGSLKYLVRSQI